jgi:hypothetical protein
MGMHPERRERRNVENAAFGAGTRHNLPVQTASTTYRNIQEICELEKKALAHRSVSARIGDIIATQAGRMWFIVFSRWRCSISVLTASLM